ncbi:disease resistance protein RUN1-like [Quercus robur]|uniref:disease resistance protein RUN1-like n=1 Tax=Quercus robur TaxID=38942 RepID=UPI0021618831|nr:disease resistance protein RUN1-like [Quercus robur]
MALMVTETASSCFPSSSSSPAVGRKYDVFLSFIGEDTHNKFMGHLHDALIQKGIIIFKDNENLERGKPISPKLLKAIKESKFAIVILSENYASSTWCLDELAKITACKKDMGMTVLPVFHYIDPSDVCKQMGTFAHAFGKHEEKENKERVEKWRDALTQVGNLSGWHLRNIRPESQDIQEIVGWISLNLKYDAFPYTTKDLVGIYSQVVELESCLALESNNVRFVGIWAMGGMGKTTLARVVYRMVSKKFEARGFIEDVREKFEKYGCVPLQQKIIKDVLKDNDLKIEEAYDGVLKIKNRLCRKRILLVLDDVNKLEQLKLLVGEHNWFGSGSRIIITTRNAHLLEEHQVDEIYEVKGLNDENALQIFCSKAFKEKHVLEDYRELSFHFLNYAGGLPLALEVLGSFLFGKSIVEWKIALERLKEFPEEAILRVLEISFNGLQKSQKEIFLHIACFFNHQDKDEVVEILDILGLYLGIGLKDIDNSLLKIMDNDIVWMHDLLEEMGRKIVFQECPDNPGKRSRLWGIEALKAMDISTTYNEPKDARWNPEAFLKMENLKFLRIFGFLHVPSHLPNDLRILDWTLYPSKSLPSSFQLDKLVQLCLRQSKIERLWIGVKNFDKLKFIDLTVSLDLIITPDFTGVSNLEKLVLEYCTNLCELHPSIGILKKLVLLNLQYCKTLRRLPSTFEVGSLVTLNLSGCSNLKKLPQFVGNLKCLQKLFLDIIAIMKLPSSVGGLISLTSLTLSDCKNLWRLPNTIFNLKSLESLDLSWCSTFEYLPKNLGNVEGLKTLDLSGIAIEELPLPIEGLVNLTLLTLVNCEKLVYLPSAISSLKSLESLELSGCLEFEYLPENLGSVIGLKELKLSGTSIKDLTSSIEHLTNLTLLTLRDCKNLVCLPNTFWCLKLGNSLDLAGCTKIEKLPGNLGNVEGLEKLDFEWNSYKRAAFIN